jgi:hypothetical protein
MAIEFPEFLPLAFAPLFIEEGFVVGKSELSRSASMLGRDDFWYTVNFSGYNFRGFRILVSDVLSIAFACLFSERCIIFCDIPNVSIASFSFSLRSKTTLPFPLDPTNVLFP